MGNEELYKMKMKLIKEEGNSLLYTNGDVELEYLINTSIPEHLEMIEEKIRGFDTLLVMGHHPHSDIMKYTDKKIKFIGAEGTYYGDKEHENEDNIIYKLYNIL